MMKSAYFALLIVLLGCISQSQAYYYYHPWKHVIPRAHPLPPKAIQCIRDLTIEGNCTKAVVNGYHTGKLDLGHECCEAVANMKDDCVLLVFARFNTPSYFPFLKKYCSKKVAKPPTTSPIVGQPTPQPPSEQPQPPSESPPVVGEPLPPSEQPQPPSESPPVVGEPLPPSEQPPSPSPSSI
ncbi:hypothetical protein M5689_022887 [Euphorbia peplus]|nr:hypothetical protein M5689_022887 [Euphorbia peplus]